MRRKELNMLKAKQLVVKQLMILVLLATTSGLGAQTGRGPHRRRSGVASHRAIPANMLSVLSAPPRISTGFSRNKPRGHSRCRTTGAPRSPECRHSSRICPKQRPKSSPPTRAFSTWLSTTAARSSMRRPSVRPEPIESQADDLRDRYPSLVNSVITYDVAAPTALMIPRNKPPTSSRA